MAPSNIFEEPAMRPPEGIVPHLSTNSPEQTWYYVCVSFCSVVSGVLLSLRLYTKLRIIRKVDATDC